MSDTRGLDHPCAFKLDWLGAQVVEQPDAITEQDGCQINAYFVEKPRFQALLRDTRGGYGHVLVACTHFCLCNRAFDAVGDEGEGRSFVNPFLWDPMGNNEARCKGWMALPGSGQIEHSPS